MNPTPTLPLLRYLHYLPALLLLLLLPRAGSGQTLAPPPDSAVTTQVNGCKQVVISWHPSRQAPRCENRQSLVVIQRLDNATLPVPVDGQTYIGFGLINTGTPIPGNQLGPGQYVVAAGPDSTVTVPNLQGGTAYRIDVFAYCAGYDENYDPLGPFYSPAAASPLTGLLSGFPIATPTCQTVVAPTQGSRLTRATLIDCSTLQMTVRKGNGQGRLLIAQRQIPDFTGPELPTAPNPGESFFPSNLFRQGQRVAIEAYAVALGPDTTTTIYGLVPGQRYKLISYEFNSRLDGAGNPTYEGLQYTAPLDTAYLAVPSCGAPEPIYPTRRLVQTDTATTSAKVKWRSGSGVGRIGVLRLIGGSSLGVALPVQTMAYEAGAYGVGDQARPGAYVVLNVAAADSSATLTGLSAGATYQLSLYEYNTLPNAQPTYLLSQAAASTLIFTRAPSDEPLPVTLVRFEARRVDNVAELRWTTATELNNAFFLVERSADGRRFEPLGQVPAAGTGTSSGHTYRYVDTRALPAAGNGLTYYRLRQQDLDGQQQYSAVVVLSGPAAPLQVSVWPNPIEAGQQLRLQVPADWNKPGLQVTIRSLSSAKAVLTAPLAATGQLQLPAGIASGVYLVEVSSPTGQRRTTRLLIR